MIPSSSTLSLAERLRGGDPGAISRFRERHVDRLRAYCEVACSAELLDEAVEAGFVDFLGRVQERRLADDQLEQALLQAIRAAAAARMPVEAGEPDCAAVPELLAARANDELPGDDRILREHLRDCPVCQGARTRMERAETAFAPLPAVREPPDAVQAAPDAVQAVPDAVPEAAPAPLPASEAAPVPASEAAPVPVPEAAPVPEPEPIPDPAPEPEPPSEPAAAPALQPPAPPPPAAAPAPIIVRRRTGGLVGAIRKRVRPPVS